MPRDSRIAPSDAAAMPFPREETTPPVTKTYLVMEISAAGKPNCSRKTGSAKLADTFFGPRISAKKDAIGYDWHFVSHSRNTEKNMNRSHATRQITQPSPGSELFRRLVAALLVAALALAISACGKQQENQGPADSNASSLVVETPLIKATARASLKEIKALIDAGEDVNGTDVLGRSPLHIAAFYGHLKVTELLLANGADINAKDQVGMTALHAAALSGGRQEVQILLSKNADIAAQSDAGQTALHLAAATGQPKLTKLLIDRGANPHTLDANGKTPLFYAQQNTHPQTTEVLKHYMTPKK